MKDFAAAIALIAVLGFVAFWGWLRFRRESAQSQLLFEAQKHLLDKLGSTAEMAQFLSSADGKDQMIEELCPMEASVLLARRTGQWTETHERHIADCANCRELLKVAGFMNGIADNLRRDPALPDPVLVWLKAQWIEREESHRRYLARIAVRRALVQAGVLLVLAVLVLGIWSGAAATSVDETIFFTLGGTFALLFLGGYFMVWRWRRMLVP